MAVAQWVHPTNQIFTQYLDGSDKKQITSGTEHAWHPAFSANGATVVFYRSDPVNGNYRLYKVPSGGGTATPITTAADNSVNPVFCENGLIAFYRQTDATGPYRPSLINLNGGQLTNVSSALTSTVPAWISFFPGTQNKEGLQVVKNGTVYQLWRFSQGVFGQEIGSTSAGLDGVFCSPVGNYALYFFYHDTNPGIYIFDSTNQSSSLLIPGATARSPHWGAYTTVRNMVGTGSRLGATSGGFLFGQEGDIVRSFISFDATTRTSIDVTPQENPNPTQANAVCTITADSLTSLKYLNSMAGGAVTVLTPSTPASGAVVSFNADTGRVASVVPFNGNVSTRSASTYTGDFTGIWDSSGKNIAPSGAKAVEFDRSTGSAKVVQ